MCRQAFSLTIANVNTEAAYSFQKQTKLDRFILWDPFKGGKAFLFINQDY